MFRIFIKHLAVIICLVALTACGGSSGEGTSLADSLRNGGGGDTGGGGDDGGGAIGTGAAAKIGSGVGDTFTEGVLSVPSADLQAGGSVTVTVNLVDAANNAISEGGSVTFSSNCYASGLASFDPPSAETVAGRASTVYTASGCSGVDEVVASAEINGATQSAAVELSIAPDAVLALQYVEAQTTTLALAGMGGIETTRVTFKLVGAQGSPIRNELVSFALNTNLGGVQLAEGTDSATSDNEGLVTTVLQSGTVSTTVRVTATHNATGKNTISENITISTGVPVDNRLSLSASVFNPGEAIDTDNVAVTLNVIAGDQVGNPALDGTQVSFWTPESGVIEDNCTLMNGQCSVEWLSAAPRPLNARLTILAYTNGAEGFGDTNGNRIFDANDSASWLLAEFDVSEPCVDENENGFCEPDSPTYEFFVDENKDGELSPGNGIWNGPCLAGVNPAALCPGADSVMISRTATIVMPTNHPRIHGFGTFPPEGGTITIPLGGVADLGGMYISDSNFNADPQGSNPMPAGTTITFSTNNGEILAGGPWTVGSAITPTGPYGIILKGDDTPSSDFLTLEIESGPVTTTFFWNVTD